MHGVLLDLRQAARRIARKPGMFALAVLSLAVALAPNVALFSVMDRILLAPVPVTAPEELAQISMLESRPAEGVRYWNPSWPEFLELSRELRAFTGVVFEGRQGMLLSTGRGRRLAFGELVSENYFDVLGVKFSAGRGFAGVRAPVVISHNLWLREFGGDAGVIGRELSITGQMFTIAGVTPPDFDGLARTLVPFDVWCPMDAWLELQPKFRPLVERRDALSGSTWARLKPGVSLAAASSDVERVLRQMAEASPAEYRGLTGLAWAGLEDRQRGGRMMTLIGVMLLGLLLAVACANVSGLLLAQAEERRHETAVRQALGASRARLVRQWVVESWVMAMAGAALGLAAAVWIMGALPSLVPTHLLPVRFEFALNARVWGYSAVLLAAATLGAGLVPAWRASRPDVLAGLRRESTVSLARWRVPPRSVLIVTQVAVAEILLFSAGWMLDALGGMRRIDPGFIPDRPVVMANLIFAPDAHNRMPAPDALTAAMERVPSVRKVSYSRMVPVSGRLGPTVRIETGLEAPLEVLGGSAGPEFLTMMGIRFALGRDLRAGDRDAVVVDMLLARTLTPGGDVVGRILRVDGKTLQVVGVFRDVAWTGLHQAPRPRLLTLTPSTPQGEIVVAAEVAGDPRLAVTAIERELRPFTSNAVLVAVNTLGQHYDASLFVERTATQGLYGLGLLALVLTAAGLHGVTAALFLRRAKEFGVRLALGATSRQLMGLVVRDALRLVGIGVALGLAIAVPLATLAASTRYGLSPWSLPAVGLSAAIVLAMALAAALHPARRALKLNATGVLRSE